MEKKELFRIMAAVCCVSWLSRWLKNMVSAL
jgi:hypothetical protein